jgi:hypothetical protein
MDIEKGSGMSDSQPEESDERKKIRERIIKAFGFDQPEEDLKRPDRVLAEIIPNEKHNGEPGKKYYKDKKEVDYEFSKDPETRKIELYIIDEEIAKRKYQNKYVGSEYDIRKEYGYKREPFREKAGLERLIHSAITMRDPKLIDETLNNYIKYIQDEKNKIIAQQAKEHNIIEP